jgi:uncharacterized protein (TIGR02001 family)
MKKSLIALALVSAFAAPAFAEEAAAPAAEAPALTGNIGLVSNYVFRGISQSQNKPALQGGFDYNHSSGLYIGFWGSNVGWVEAGGYKANNSLETDFYAGYKGSFADDFTFDVGAIKYYYPGTTVAGKVTPDTIEGYVALGWKFVTLKYSHTLSEYMVAWGDQNTSTRNSNYLDLSANYDLGNGWGVNAHVGRQEIRRVAPASYTDWKLGVTKDIGFGVVGLSYTDTDAEGCGSASGSYCWNGKDVAKAAGILSFTKTF